jgi:hypothetical protein
MIPKEIISKAIEGGWWNVEYGGAVQWPLEMALRMSWQEIALMPTFWQALGKALGWRQNGRITMYEYDGISKDPVEVKWTDSFTWAIYAHRFYDLILTGGDTEQYWKDLLK